MPKRLPVSRPLVDAPLCVGFAFSDISLTLLVAFCDIDQAGFRMSSREPPPHVDVERPRLQIVLGKGILKRLHVRFDNMLDLLVFNVDFSP